MSTTETGGGVSLSTHETTAAEQQQQQQQHVLGGLLEIDELHTPPRHTPTLHTVTLHTTPHHTHLGSRDSSCILVLSPSMEPPVRTLDGSIEITATRLPSAVRRFPRTFSRETHTYRAIPQAGRRQQVGWAANTGYIEMAKSYQRGEGHFDPVGVCKSVNPPEKKEAKNL